MNVNHLQIYLNDHLALMVGELQLAERCAHSNPKEELGRCLTKLVGDLRIERQVVEELIRQSGGRPDMVKQGTAWLAEKIGRLKMNGSWLEYSDLSRLLELETLELAAHERAVFWQNIEHAVEMDGTQTIVSTNVARYYGEAMNHCSELSNHRLDAVRAAFVVEGSPGAQTPACCDGSQDEI